MHFTSVFIGVLLGAVAALPAPIADPDAVVNTRFGTYENEARNAEPDAVVNTRFGAYENEARNADPDAVVNTRFGAYETEA
ncbi:hypothetical protein F4825DRAFT_429008 [Nemania diffusa]|nr:hypothetical protein F4825DRAFT_429008 [Nemania diffusa]